MAFKVPERFRIKTGSVGTDAKAGNNGVFAVRVASEKRALLCQASDGDGWEHVSVSIPKVLRCPSWTTMCDIKALFWGVDDLVVQYHPMKNDYVNYHPFCLHLWRKFGTNDFCETPPTYMIGPKT